MPRRKEPARLYLRERKARSAVWVIRDGSHETSTGRPENDYGGAEGELEKYLAKKRPNTAERDLAKIPVAEVLMLYSMEVAPKLPSKDLIAYHNKALATYWGDKHLSDVKKSKCEAYAAHRVKAGVKEATARRELKTLQAAINYWHTESPLPAVPSVTLPNESPRRERFLERWEAAALLRACRKRRAPHVARFILIGLYTGTRHDAILKLRWSKAIAGGHIDLERGILYRRGAGERETSKRRPPIRIGSRLLGHCRRWADLDRGHDHVIRYEGAPIRKMKRAWAGVVKEAGLGPDVKPHVLRHTFVTWQLWTGRSIWDVAGDAGASASMIEKVYGHHRPLASEAPVSPQIRMNG